MNTSEHALGRFEAEKPDGYDWFIVTWTPSTVFGRSVFRATGMIGNHAQIPVYPSRVNPELPDWDALILSLMRRVKVDNV